MAAGNTAPRPGRGRRLIPATFLLALAVLSWAGWRLYEEERASAGRLFGSGSIEATQVDVSPRVAGRVINLAVDEGDRVEAGQVLAELEPQNVLPSILSSATVGSSAAPLTAGSPNSRLN